VTLNSLPRLARPARRKGFTANQDTCGVSCGVLGRWGALLRSSPKLDRGFNPIEKYETKKKCFKKNTRKTQDRQVLRQFYADTGHHLNPTSGAPDALGALAALRRPVAPGDL